MKRQLTRGASILAVALLSGACVAGGSSTWTEAPAPPLPGPVTNPVASQLPETAPTGSSAPAGAGVAAPSSAPAQGTSDAMPGMTGSATASAYTLPAADPNAPPYQLYDATAPAVLPGTVHTITLTIQEKDFTIATGYVVHAWTFNGTVPGPVIRVHYGDTVRVHIVNPATSTMPHSVDFHASQVAANGPMRSINPGQDAWYVWHADYAGVWMYHCGTTPAIGHMANGMYGMVIVEPKGGLPKVDREFTIVQSEWYFGGQGKPADIARAMSPDPAPDFVVFNGVANQYRDHPLHVDAGKTVRMFLLDAGPNVWESFHVVGTIFNTVIKEGIELLPGNAGGWGSQAVDLAPAQGAIVQFVPAENGTYTMVTHQFNDVGLGAIGVIQAGDGVYTGASQK
jgi:nitrite reductase (NO-forming)